MDESPYAATATVEGSSVLVSCGYSKTVVLSDGLTGEALLVARVKAVLYISSFILGSLVIVKEGLYKTLCTKG